MCYMSIIRIWPSWPLYPRQMRENSSSLKFLQFDVGVELGLAVNKDRGAVNENSRLEMIDAMFVADFDRLMEYITNSNDKTSAVIKVVPYRCSSLGGMCDANVFVTNNGSPASDVFVGLGSFAKDHWEVIKMYFAVPPHVLKKIEGRIFTGTGRMPKDADGLREYVFKMYEDFLHGKHRPALDSLDALAAYLVNDVKYLKKTCPKGGLYRIEFCHMFDSYPHELFDNTSPFLQVAANQMCSCVDLMLVGQRLSSPKPILRAFDFEAMLDFMVILVEDSVESVLGTNGTFRKALVQGEFDDDGLIRVRLP